MFICVYILYIYTCIYIYIFVGSAEHKDEREGKGGGEGGGSHTHTTPDAPGAPPPSNLPDGLPLVGCFPKAGCMKKERVRCWRR